MEQKINELKSKIDKIVDSISIEELDSKFAEDALHMLLHCSLKDTEYETQKEQFKIVYYYIKQLEKENKKLLIKNNEWESKIKNMFENIQLLYEENLKLINLKEIEPINEKIFEGIRLEAQRDLLREFLKEE